MQHCCATRNCKKLQDTARHCKTLLFSLISTISISVAVCVCPQRKSSHLQPPKCEADNRQITLACELLESEKRGPETWQDQLTLWMRFFPLLKNQPFQIPIRSGECPHTIKRISPFRHEIMRLEFFLSFFFSSFSQTFPIIFSKASSTRIRKFVKTQFFLRTRLSSTRIKRIFRPYPEIFENAPQCGNFFIRYEYVYVWTVVSGNFWIRFRHSLGSSLHGEHYKQTWRTASRVVASLLVALISSLTSCVQINAAVINWHNQYIRDRQDVLRLLSMNCGHHKVKKRANHHRRRFWTRPGRTSAWWDNFINGIM